MNTLSFLSELHALGNKNIDLIFDYGDKQVKPGYHVTEVKSASIQTMDCGGQGNAWHETTLQLWAPDSTDETYMSVDKFLNIYNRVSSSISVEESAEMRVEYGDIGSPAISYVVTSVEKTAEAVTIKLHAPAVACKGADRSVGDIPVVGSAASCCSPAPAISEELEELPVMAGACC